MKLSLMIFFMFYLVSIVNSQWYQQTIPETISLNSVFMVDENIAYAVGGSLQGDFMKTIDGGSTWHVIPSFTDAILHSVYFLDSDTGFVGGQFGQILKTTDGGFSWMFSQTETNQVITDIDFVDNRTGFACGTGGLFLKTIDGGTNWEKIELPNNAFSFSSVDFIDAKIGFLIGSPSFKTTDGGLTWQEMTFQYSSPSDIFMIDSQIGFVSRYNTEEGGVYKTVNGGDTWTLYTGTISEPLSSIFFTSPDIGYACGGFYSPPNGPSSYIVKTTDGGNSWFEQDSEFGSNLLSIYFGSKSNGIAVSSSLIIGTDNEGGVTSVNEFDLLNPSDFELSQNYPNPFNPSTKIQYTIAKSPLLGGDGRGGLVALKVYDILGREVTVLVNEQQKPGYYEVQFNASGLTSGIYFYKLQAGSYIQTKKMLLLR